MSTITNMLVGTIVLVLLMGSFVFTPMAVYGVTGGILLPVIPIPPLSPPVPYPIKYIQPYPYPVTTP